LIGASGRLKRTESPTCPGSPIKEKLIGDLVAVVARWRAWLGVARLLR
jgi:hypothetical protein